MEHSEEYYKMKYFKYKAKYIKEKQRIEQDAGMGRSSMRRSGMSLAKQNPGVKSFGQKKIGMALRTSTGKAPVGKDPNEIKKQKQKKFNEIIAILVENKKTGKLVTDMTEDDITKLKDYDTIVELIKKLKLLDEKELLNKFWTCHTYMPWKKIDEECLPSQN